MTEDSRNDTTYYDQQTAIQASYLAQEQAETARKVAANQAAKGVAALNNSVMGRSAPKPSAKGGKKGK